MIVKRHQPAILFIAFFTLFSNYIHAQSEAARRVDSLINVLRKATTDTARINIMSDIVKEQLIQYDSVNAFRYAYASVSLAKKVESPLHKAYADYVLGYIHAAMRHEDSAIYYYNRVTAQLKDNPSPRAIKLLVYAVNNLATVYSANGNLRKCADLLTSNLSRLGEINDQQAYEFTINNITESFNLAGEYRKAYPFMLKNIALAKQNQNADSRVNPYLVGALVMYKLDSLSRMNEYLIEAKRNIDSTGRFNDYMGKYLAYKASYYASIGQLKTANEVMSEGLLLFKQQPAGINNFYDIYTAKKEIAVAEGNFRLAKETALELYTEARKEKYAEIFLTNAAEIATYSARLQDYKSAYAYADLYARLSDSVRYAQTVLQVYDLETKYQAVENEKQINRLQAEKQQVLLENENKELLNSLLGAGAGVLLLVTLLLVYIYRGSKKQAVLKLKKVEQEQELKLAQALLDGEERERSRVARDLHDGLGGALAGIKLKLANEPLVNNEVVEQLEDSIDELRRIARNLMPERLMQSGLETALRDLCASFADKNQRVEFQSNGLSQQLPLTTQVNIYRIIQELLANAVKHSGATEIIVQAIRRDNQCLITVEDNGKGFEVADPKYANGLGLSNIYNRVNNLGGRMDIASGTDEGTAVNIELYV